MSAAEPSTLEGDAALVAAVARAVDRDEWAAEASRIARSAEAPALPSPPTYRELALAGVTLVLGLAEAGRWAEATSQAEHLATYFAGARERLDMVADQGFRGLAGAAATEDREALGDFAGLLIELFSP